MGGLARADGATRHANLLPGEHLRLRVVIRDLLEGPDDAIHLAESCNGTPHQTDARHVRQPTLSVFSSFPLWRGCTAPHAPGTYPPLVCISRYFLFMATAMRGLLGFLLSRCLAGSGGGGAMRECHALPFSPALPPSRQLLVGNLTGSPPYRKPSSHQRRHHYGPCRHNHRHNHRHNRRHDSAGAAALRLGGPAAVRDPALPWNPRRRWSQGCRPRRKFASPESRSHGPTATATATATATVTVTVTWTGSPHAPTTTTDCNVHTRLGREISIYLSDGSVDVALASPTFPSHEARCGASLRIG